MASVVPNGRIRQVKQRYGTYALLEDGRVINDAVAGQHTVILNGQGQNVTPPPPAIWHGVSTPQQPSQSLSTVLLPSRPSIQADRRLSLYRPFVVTLTSTLGEMRLSSERGTCVLADGIDVGWIALRHTSFDSNFSFSYDLGWNESLARFMQVLPNHDFPWTHPEEGWVALRKFSDKPEDYAAVSAKLNNPALFGVIYDNQTYATWTSEGLPSAAIPSVQYRGIYRKPVAPANTDTIFAGFNNIMARNLLQAMVTCNPIGYGSPAIDVTMHLDTLELLATPPTHPLVQDLPFSVIWEWTITITVREYGSAAGRIRLELAMPPDTIQPDRHPFRQYCNLFREYAQFGGCIFVNANGSFIRWDYLPLHAMIELVETEEGVAMIPLVEPYAATVTPPYYPTQIGGGFLF